MRRIILTQNLVIAGMITLIGLMAGFYEGEIPKQFLMALISFIVIDKGLYEIELMYLKMRGKGNAEKQKSGNRKDKGNAVSCIEWFKVRFQSLIQKDGNPGADTEAVLQTPGNNSNREGVAYRRRYGR